MPQHAVAPSQKFTAAHPCPICEGHRAMPAGQGIRCWGFLSSDREYAHCSRDELAGAVSVGPDGMYAHRLKGDCKCGKTHGEAPERPEPQLLTIPSQSRTTASAPVETIFHHGDFLHIKTVNADGSKKFRWQNRDGTSGLGGVSVADIPLYGWSRLAGADLGSTVIVTEGETPRAALQEAGILAVGTVTGANTCPSPKVLEALRGFDVVLWPDNDAVGAKHMAAVRTALTAMDIASRTLSWPGATEKGDDAADFLARGGTPAELEELLRAAEDRHATDPHRPRLNLIRMSDVVPDEIDWLWRGRFARGKPTLLMGDPGLGKSLITHWVAAKVSVGGEWPDGGECPQGAAILFTVEDGLADTVAPRLIAAGADMSRVYAVQGVIDPEASIDDKMFALNQHIALLEEAIEQTGATFVVMDPISAYLGADVNSHNESDVRAILGPLQVMTERTRIALCMLLHLNKGTGVAALYRASGSIAFPAACRVVLGVARDPNDDDGERRLVLPIKMNVGRAVEGIGYRINTTTESILVNTGADDQPPIIEWDSETVSIEAMSAMDRAGSVTEMGVLAEAKAAILQILADGRLPANEVKRQLRESVGAGSETTLSRARKEIGVRVRREGFGPGGIWWWELTPRKERPIPPSSETPSSMQSKDGMGDLSVPYPSEPDPIEHQPLLDLSGTYNTIEPKDSILPVKSSEGGPGLCRSCNKNPVVPGKYLCSDCTGLVLSAVVKIDAERPS